MLLTIKYVLELGWWQKVSRRNLVLTTQIFFSPVVRHSTLRLLFALSVKMRMNIVHLDVTTAFLNGFLKENICHYLKVL